jgi:CDP-diacylglycerol--serine O-phosphatidyltransferase
VGADKGDKSMLGFYNYTVVLTYIGMLSAFCGILLAGSGNIDGAVLCLMTSGICDMFDGPIARTMERTPEEKKFGIQIDSLSDLISFGVLPGVILYRITEASMWGIVAAALYVLCALIRLAYFNVMEEERQKQTTEARTCYQGLPVTVSAILIPVLCLRQSWLGFRRGQSVLAVMLVMALAFLLPIKVEKPHSLGKIILSVLGVCCLGLMIGRGIR